MTGLATTRCRRGRGVAIAAAVALALTTAIPGAARAWLHDGNGDRIDDRIEAVHANGWAAAFEDGDPAKRMRIVVENDTPFTYGVYVGWERRPTEADADALRALGVPFAKVYLYIDYIRTLATFEQIEAIAAIPGVRRVEAIPRLYPVNHVGSRVVRARDSRGFALVENFALFPSARRDLTDPAGRPLDGFGTVVAILDTGVNDEQDSLVPSYPGHESLAGKFVGGGEFFNSDPALNTQPGQSMNPEDHGGAASQYHATHVAGTAIGNGGPGGIYAGVAPAARLADCKTLSDAGASTGAADALEWCVFNRNTLWPGLAGADTAYRGVDVLNLSLGTVEGSDGTDAQSLAVNAAVRAGLVVVVATGNFFSTNSISSPASADSCISVGASLHGKTLARDDDIVAFFSNEGPRADDGDADALDEMKPSVVAPGLGIVSANGDPATNGRLYKQLQGTSMACPHVAGVAALVLQANPALDPLEVRRILQDTAEHGIPSEKGPRPNDPFSVDPNYNAGSGWGVVDAYAACKEAVESASGVQVTQIRPLLQGTPASPTGVDVTWITQREHPFLGFHVDRAPGTLDTEPAPAAFARVNPALLPPSPAGDPVIEGDDNRTPYGFLDTDPALAAGTVYWYRISWVDLLSVEHPEPAAPIVFGTLPRVATAHYSIRHDAVDTDLDIRVGTSGTYEPGAAEFVTGGPSEDFQDSTRLLLPPDPFVAPTVGNTEHFWSIPFTTADGIEPWLPPSMLQPWFLDVREGAFVDRTGQLTGFSLFVNDSPGSAGGTTFVTDTPTPLPTVHDQRSTLWIPEQVPVAAQVARFTATGEAGGVRLVLELAQAISGAAARAYRGVTSDPASRVPLGPAPEPIVGSRVTLVDRTVEAGEPRWYWVDVLEADGGVIRSGPIRAAALTAAGATTFLRLDSSNPSRDAVEIEFGVGVEVAGSGRAPVELAIFDLRGRRVRTLFSEPAVAGIHRARWDGRDTSGRAAPAGVYLLRYAAGGSERVLRLTRLR